MLETTLVADVQQLQKQVEIIEHHVFGTKEGPEVRFEYFERRMNDLERQQKVDHQHFTGKHDVVDQRHELYVFETDNRLKRCEDFEDELDRIKTWLRNQEKQFQQTIEDMLKKHQEFMQETQKTISTLNKDLVSVIDRATYLEINTGKLDVSVRSLDQFRTKTYETIEILKKDLASIKEKKTDITIFE